MTYVVKNRDTDIVVSRWNDEESAWADKDKRDRQYADVEPIERSRLIVERGDAGSADVKS